MKFLKYLLIVLHILLYIRVSQSDSLVPICCHKGESEENCKLRIENSEALFDEKSVLRPGYQCLVDTKYECYDIDIRIHEPSGKFTFEGIIYNKDQYCFNDKGQFCLFQCRVPVCCSNSLKDLECIGNYATEDGNVVIPDNSITTGKASKCPGYTVEICVNNEQVSVQNNDIILKNANNDAFDNKNYYCLNISNSEDNCEPRCWENPDISYPITICCSSEEDVEQCVNSFKHLSILPSVQVYMRNMSSFETKVCSNETSLTLSDKGLNIENELRTGNFCVESIDNIQNFCILLSKENKSSDSEYHRLPHIIVRIISEVFLFLTLIIYFWLWERNTHTKVFMLLVACLMFASLLLIIIQPISYTKNTSHSVLSWLYLCLSVISEILIGLVYWGLYRNKEKHTGKFLYIFGLLVGLVVSNGIGIAYEKFTLALTILNVSVLLVLNSFVTLLCICFFILTIIKINKGFFENYDRNNYKRTYGLLLIARICDIVINIISIFIENNLSSPLSSSYITDVYSAAYSIFIFVLFVCNKRSYRILKWKLSSKPVFKYRLREQTRNVEYTQ